MFILDKEEKIILENSAKCDGKSGTIFLTNKRLKFQYTEGLFSKKTFTSLDILVNDVELLSVEGLFKKKLYIKSKKRAGRTEIEVKDPENLKMEIEMLLV